MGGSPLKELPAGETWLPHIAAAPEFLMSYMLISSKKKD
jgi:hypothetical protein